MSGKTIGQYCTHPCDNTWVALVVVDQNLELTSELFLLLCVWLSRAERWHVLNKHNAHLVTGLIEQVRFDFDLFRVDAVSLCAPYLDSDDSRVFGAC